MQTNQNISCSVNECTHHANSENYCTLQQINVGKCQGSTCSCADTECASFHAK
ncbi:MAG: DUF1540 domain-containing protein [Lachnospiraceae bacterium]|nr:DUF1540 domain-containing protein [Lachnospiraceae bacterium]